MATSTQPVSATMSQSSDTNSSFYPFPYSLSPLPDTLRHGLIAPGTLGLLSVASCIGMLLFIIYRFFTWRAHYRNFVGYNQYVVLIINLLLADLLQGVSFMFSFHWVYHDGILAPSRTCFTQGYLLNMGDLASGFFVLGIAMHTFYGAVRGKHAKHTTFTAWIISAWLIAALLTSIGPIWHHEDFFVRAGAWCWISPKYERERLALHYVWIFMVQFGVVVIYTLIFLHLKQTMSHILPSSHSATHAKVDRAAKLMVLFPIAYVVLTLPLSAGRMWSMAHEGASLPEAYALTAGSMIGSCGLVDCLLYTLTRRSLIANNKNQSKATNDSYGKSDFSRTPGITQIRTVTVTGGRLSTIYDEAESVEMDSVPPHVNRFSTTKGAVCSRNSSQDRLVMLDCSKANAKAEVTTTQIECLRESDESGRPSDDRKPSVA
ncbi:hypothetical protein MBLNU459_g2454t1 [Dothideomycetes sp. NU459]